MKRIVQNHSRYAQLEGELRRRILAGELAENRPIPSEAELCAEYATSRNTVRKALQKLVDQNFLRKHHGLGSFVVPAAERDELRRAPTKLRVIFPPSDGGKNLDRFDAEAIAGIEACAKLRNCTVECQSSPAVAARLLADYRNLLCDGFLWLRATAAELAIAAELRDRRIPQVLIERTLPGVPEVGWDSAGSLDETVAFLHALGHRNLAFVCCDKAQLFLPPRLEAFADSCSRHGCSGRVLNFCFNALEESGRAAVAAAPEVTAYICVSSLYGLLNRILSRVRRPDSGEAAVVAFITYSLRALSGVTRVCQPLSEIGAAAAELLCSWDFRDRNAVPPRRLISGYLINGFTTAPRRVAEPEVPISFSTIKSRRCAE